jgi:hypothetical protein
MEVRYDRGSSYFRTSLTYCNRPWRQAAPLHTQTSFLSFEMALTPDGIAHTVFAPRL